ncbi:MAG TPA: hypothetical protein VNM48_04195, partial [Chloroflexota bacterium]|nr:hypothetical protein [Chloroflexota bacterium]
ILAAAGHHPAAGVLGREGVPAIRAWLCRTILMCISRSVRINRLFGLRDFCVLLRLFERLLK